jgi:hypothetical protein
VTSAAPPAIGDIVYLKSILANLHIYAVITDPNTPNQFAITAEYYGDDGALTAPAIVGPKGDAGDPMFALRFINDPTVTKPSDLPTDLTNTEADIGKYYILDTLDTNNNVIGTTAYIWYGTQYRQMMMGTQGPPGPYPVITPTCTLIPPNQVSYVDVSGTIADPTFAFYLAAPQGPQGLGGYDPRLSTTFPLQGQSLVYNGKLAANGVDPLYEPTSLNDLIPMPYSVPESAFISQFGITATRQTVCTFAVPQQPFTWKPWVEGHMHVYGVEVSSNPLQVGCEVRLGDANTGPVVAFGWGDMFGAINLMPHFSSSSSPSTALTPNNALAKVVANHTGTSGTLYVNIVNTGLAAAFDYNNTDSQLAVTVLPIPPTPPPGS